MKNSNFDENSFKVFKTFDANTKINAMELYLIGDPITHNCLKMQEVAEKLGWTGNSQYSQYISCITRGYNFAGNNSGRYKKNCDFEKRHGYEITRADIEAYVDKYPNGTMAPDNVPCGPTFEEFLMTRIQKNGNRPSTVKRNNVLKHKKGVANVNSSRPDHNIIPQNNSFNVSEQFEKVDFDNVPNNDYYQNDESDMSEFTEKFKGFFQGSSNLKSKIISVLGILVIVLILIFGFNIFGLRAVVTKFIMQALWIIWLVAEGVFFIMALINKIPFISKDMSLGKRMLIFAVSSVVIFVILNLIFSSLHGLTGAQIDIYY